MRQQRIYDSGLYSDVQMELGKVDSATAASDIVVTVRERKMGWIDAGIGYEKVKFNGNSQSRVAGVQEDSGLLVVGHVG